MHTAIMRLVDLINHDFNANVITEKMITSGKGWVASEEIAAQARIALGTNLENLDIARDSDEETVHRAAQALNEAIRVESRSPVRYQERIPTGDWSWREFKRIAMEML